jgi:WD40 repeat protein
VQSSWGCRRLEGHTDAVHSVSFARGEVQARGPTYKLLSAAGEGAKRVQSWVLPKDAGLPRQESLPQEAIVAHPKVTCTALSPDGRRFATACADQAVRLYNATSGNLLLTMVGHGVSRTIRQLAFHPEGQLLASASTDTTVRLWNLSDRREAALGVTLMAAGGAVELCGHSDWVCSPASFAPAGRMLATADADHRVCLWDVGSGRLLHRLLGHAKWVTSVAFSPDGELLASGSYDCSVRLWAVPEHAGDEPELLLVPQLEDQPSAGTNLPTVEVGTRRP